MESIKFKESNCTIAKNQKPYIPLPAYKDISIEGYTVTCWKLSLKDKIKIIFTGKIWLQILTFNKPIQPLLMTIEKPLFKGSEDKSKK